MEIEKKYLIRHIPVSLAAYPSKKLEQAYISVNPVIRVRKADDSYRLTVKSAGLLARQEFELDLDKAAYERLLLKSRWYNCFKAALQDTAYGYGRNNRKPGVR